MLEKGKKKMIKKLVSCIGEYKKETILTPIFVGIECFFDVIIPFLMAYLIDYGINKGNEKVIIYIGLLLVVCSFLAIYTGVKSGDCAAFATAGFAKNLRKKIYYNVQDFSFQNIDKFSTSSIITRHTTDINNIQMAF